MSDSDLKEALSRSLALSDDYDSANATVSSVVEEYAELVRDTTGVKIELVHAKSQRITASVASGLAGFNQALNSATTYREKTFSDDSENSATELALIAIIGSKSKLLLKIELSPKIGFPITVTGPAEYSSNTVETPEDFRAAFTEAVSHPLIGRKIRSLERLEKPVQPTSED